MNKYLANFYKPLRERNNCKVVVCGIRPLSLTFPSEMMPDLPKRGVLMYSTVATIFPNYESALKALGRTIKYSIDKKQIYWFENPMRIFRVEEELDS